MEAVVASLSPYLGPRNGGECLPQRAYTALRGAIRDLRLSPGWMVPERKIVEALGISRRPDWEEEDWTRARTATK
jgi:hypothetical protein